MPGGALVVTVSIELFPVVLVGLSPAVKLPPWPTAELLTDNATLPVKPLILLMVMVAVTASQPSHVVSVAGFTESVKPIPTTVSANETATGLTPVPLPLRPRTYVPGRIVAATDAVIVAVVIGPLVWILETAKVTPTGAPVRANVAPAPVKPPLPVSVAPIATDPPCATVALVGLMLRAIDGAGTMSSSEADTALTPVPLPVRLMV